MGNCCVRRNLNGDQSKNITVAILGLDDAGKTVTANVLKGDPPSEVVPTIGFKNIQFCFKKHAISMYDLGGGSRIRNIWRNYFAEVHAIIYVLDSSHRERIEECREVLINVLDDDKIKGKPVLVLGNKQDINGAMDSSEICDRLKLDALANSHQSLCRIECCSALRLEKGKADGAIVDGFQWLLDTVDMNWSDLKERVDKDVAEQKESEKQAWQERLERVRKLREEREKEGVETDEPKDFDQGDINGNPFKPIDALKLNREEDNKAKPSPVNTLDTTNSNHQLLDPLTVGSPLINEAQDASDGVISNKSEENETSFCVESGTDRLPSSDLLVASLVPTHNLSEKHVPKLPPSVLPPLDMGGEAEPGDRKRRKRRNKRNRITPLPSATDDTDPNKASDRLKIGSTDQMDAAGNDDFSTPNDISSKSLPNSCQSASLALGDSIVDTSLSDDLSNNDIRQASKSSPISRSKGDYDEAVS